MYLLELMNNLSAEQMKSCLASLPGKIKKPTTKADMAKLLATSLSDDSILSDHWDRLSQAEQWALQESVHNHNGQIHKPYFSAKYERAYPPMKQYRKEEALDVYFYPTARLRGTNLIPADLLDRLKSLIPPPPDFVLPSSDALPAEQFATHESALQVEREFNALVNLVKQNKLKISAKTGLPSKAALVNLSQLVNELYTPSADGNDDNLHFIKSFAWVQVMRAASWISESNGVLKINAKKYSFSEPLHILLKELLASWINKSDFDEFKRINEVKGQTGKGARYFTSKKERRQHCANTLKLCPVNEWVSIKDFLRLTIISGNSHPVTSAPDYLYICDSAYGRLYEGNNGILENSYIRCLLMEYFSTLGVIDIAYQSPVGQRKDYRDFWGAEELDYFSRYDGAQYTRLTELGAYLLGVTSNYTPKKNISKTAVTMLSKNKLIFTHTPTASEETFISNYAKNLADNSWHLSNEKMLMYIENGGKLDELTVFLSERDPQPYFPLETERLLKELEANKHAVVKEGPVLLLSCRSAEVANKIACIAEISRWCQRVGENQLIIPLSKENKLRKLIHQLNYAMPIAEK